MKMAVAAAVVVSSVVVVCTCWTAAAVAHLVVCAAPETVLLALSYRRHCYWNLLPSIAVSRVTPVLSVGCPVHAVVVADLVVAAAVVQRRDPLVSLSDHCH